MTALRAVRTVEEVGCVLAREVGFLVVLTGLGEVRASFGGGLLGEVARDRARLPDPGEWVVLRRWSDGPVTVERTLSRPPAPLATVLPLRGPHA